MMTYQIEKNVPVSSASPRKKVSEYPVKELKVGDSFVVPKAFGECANAIYAEARRRGKKVQILSVPEGVRVWRVRKPRSDK